MGPFEKMRDALRSGARKFTYLDAAQLVKHAFGLVTEGQRIGKRPALLYLFAEPAARGGEEIFQTTLQKHREEIAIFADIVSEAEVSFASLSYKDWLATWDAPEVQQHGIAIGERFAP